MRRKVAAKIGSGPPFNLLGWNVPIAKPLTGDAKQLTSLCTSRHQFCTAAVLSGRISTTGVEPAQRSWHLA
jgi:hypothetical protein